jgi:hypothetical protein
MSRTYTPEAKSAFKEFIANQMRAFAESFASSASLSGTLESAHQTLTSPDFSAMCQRAFEQLPHIMQIKSFMPALYEHAFYEFAIRKQGGFQMRDDVSYYVENLESAFQSCIGKYVIENEAMRAATGLRVSYEELDKAEYERFAATGEVTEGFRAYLVRTTIKNGETTEAEKRDIENYIKTGESTELLEQCFARFSRKPAK